MRQLSFLRYAAEIPWAWMVPIYGGISSYITYLIYRRRERTSCYRRILATFLSMACALAMELFFGWRTGGFLQSDALASVLKISLFTTLFTVISFQQVGILECAAGTYRRYLLGCWLPVLAADALRYFYPEADLYRTEWLVFSLLGLHVFLAFRFYRSCTERFESIVPVITRKNFQLLSFLLLIVLLTCSVVALAISGRGTPESYVPALIVILGFQFIFLYIGCPGFRISRSFSGNTADGYKSSDTENISVLTDMAEEGNNDERMIIQRLVQYFEKEKPYLNPDLKIGAVALQIYTNKTYLSRALNHLMSKNFNQFVNYYRIKEACRMLMKEPSLKVPELCDKSGFNSISSFSTAFRINTGYSPAEWCKEVRSKIMNGEPVTVEEYIS